MCDAGLLLLGVLLSITPGLEARLGAPLSLHACGYTGVLASYLASSLAGVLVFTTLSTLERLLARLSPQVYRLYSTVREKLARRASGAAGFLALTLFIAVPLPGSGVWSGAILARLMGLDRRVAVAAILAGNLVAVLIVSGLASLLLLAAS